MKLYLVAYVWGMCVAGFWCEQSYLVTNDDIVHFDGQVENLISFKNLKTVGREKLINGTWIVSQDMDNDNFKYSLTMYSSPKGDGDFKRLAMGFPNTPICEGFKKFYVQFIEPSMKLDDNTNFPVVGNDGLCPIPAGEYYFKNIEFNTESWPSQVPRGIIRSVVTFSKNEVPIGGVNITVKIEDRD